jgi:anaerobic magnesium-protoporphyrin IX monomethyl ester cyclase
LNMTDFRVLLVYPNLQMVNLLPSNISILSACLKEKGFKVDLFDTTFYKVEEKSIDERRVEYLQVRPFNLEAYGIKYKDGDVYEDFVAKVNSFKPDLIAITIVEDTLPLSLAMLQKIRHLDIPVVAGGVYVTLNPSIINRPEVDMTCYGEGEEAIPELCKCLFEGGNPSSVHNIWSKQSGRVIQTAMRPPVNLDTIPYSDFDLFEETRFFRPMQGKVFRMIPIEIDRGCPYSCTYCGAPALRDIYRRGTGKNYFRTKSNKRIIDELEYLVGKYKANYIYFNSETMLTMSDDRLADIAVEYGNKIHLPFWCQTRIETITETKVDLLELMGCDRLSIGIEHGNEQFRRGMLKKHFSNAQVRDAFRILEKHKIPITVNNMMGFPGETRALIFDTIRLNRDLKVDSTNVFAFKPYHGTHLHDIAVQEGYLKEDAIITSMIDSTLDMPQLSRKEINGLIRTFPLYIRMPEDRFPELEKAEHDDDEYDRLAKEYRKVYWRIE